ncbi:hypothetical protein NLI96_g2184 [Meripilus lineatus]|uniref:UbiA prenyltransferase n=1 Tax=Meripilus lineatus TaxID=2056292 RepID=A0AAD5YM48_9APHY|nr:hypothetical protein NLI96_g2184 [Physisporinus lineatus]
MTATNLQTQSQILKPFFSTVYHIKTLYLFTKSDIKTTILPDLCIAISLTRQTSHVHILNTVLWIWILLLAFCVSNQASIQSVVEDTINKPWRPIPSSRVTIDQARTLRWILVIINLIFSTYHGNLKAAAIFLSADFAYNDLGLSAWWFTKSLLNAVGYASFQYGAVIVASGSNGFVHPKATEAVLTFCLLILTTIQAQDFYDAKGDGAGGRQTIVTLYPALSRALTAIAITAWAVVLPIFWGIAFVPSMVFTLLGTFVAGRFTVPGDQKADEASYLHYNVRIVPSVNRS